MLLLLLYSRFGLGWCVWVTSPCWCVLHVHPSVVVEKKVDIIYLLLPGEIAEYTNLATNHLNNVLEPTQSSSNVTCPSKAVNTLSGPSRKFHMSPSKSEFGQIRLYPKLGEYSTFCNCRKIAVISNNSNFHSFRESYFTTHIVDAFHMFG